MLSAEASCYVVSKLLEIQCMFVVCAKFAYAININTLGLIISLSLVGIFHFLGHKNE